VTTTTNPTTATTILLLLLLLLQCADKSLARPTYLLTYLLTYFMEQSPSWEATWFCSYSRNTRHFRNPKVHHRTHKRPPPVPILSQLHLVPTTPSHFLKIHLNIILHGLHVYIIKEKNQLDATLGTLPIKIPILVRHVSGDSYAHFQGHQTVEYSLRYEAPYMLSAVGLDAVGGPSTSQPTAGNM
jgi:hypothetical protein